MRWYVPLRRSGEIAFVRRSGRHAGTATVGVHAARSARAPTRVAVSVSKTVGKAVLRNLVKRRIKGVLDALPAPSPPLRLVIVARAQAGTLPYASLARDVRSALLRVARP